MVDFDRLVDHVGAGLQLHVTYRVSAVSALSARVGVISCGNNCGSLQKRHKQPAKLNTGMKRKYKTENDRKKIYQQIGVMLHLILFEKHLEVFHRHPQKAKAFSLFFLNVFMVLLVRPAQRQQIPVLGISEPGNTLVYKNIVYKKVRHAIYGNAQPYVKQIIKAAL